MLPSGAVPQKSAVFGPSRPALELCLVPDTTLHSPDYLGTFDTLTKDLGIISSPCLYTYIVKITNVEEKKQMKVYHGKAKLQPCNLKWALPKMVPA